MAAFITLAGNVGSDPENGVTPNGHDNIRFRVAVNTRQGQQENTTWYAVTAWGSTAKGLTTLAERGLLGKGARVLVNGSLTAREYTDRSGTPRTSLDVEARDVDLLSPPKDRQDAGEARERFRGAGDEAGSDDLNEVPF